MPMQLKYEQGNRTVLPLTASRKGILPTDISRAWIDHTPKSADRMTLIVVWGEPSLEGSASVHRTTMAAKPAPEQVRDPVRDGTVGL